ncbi:MAG: DciA family protein [Planctomycetia bacterium]
MTLPSRQPKNDPGPRPIGSVMSRLLARTGYDRQQGTEGLAAAWQEAAPASLRGCSQAGLVRRGVLEVFVSHSALVQEMGFHKREVVERLGRLAPDEGIVDIRCRVMADAGRGDGC